MQQSTAERPGAEQPPAADEVYVLPASPAQARMWFLDRLLPGSTAYVMPGAVRLRGALDVRALAEALAGIVRRHEVLRTTIAAVDGEPVQVVHPAGPAGWPLADLSALPHEARAAEAERLARAEARRGFDLARGPLLRTALLRLAADDHLALCTMHHAVSDGWSLGVLLRELGAGYAAAREGRPAALPGLPLQYADYAAWQRAWLDGPGAARQTEYWKERLGGAPMLDLPADRPRPAEPGSRGALHAFHLPPALARAVRALGARHGATPMMTLLAAFAALLARRAGQADVVVGTPVAGRNRRELEGSIGLFVNTLALRTELSGHPAFSEAVARARDAVAGAQANQDLPFERVVEALRADVDPRRNPFFEVMLTYVSAAREEVRLPGLTLAAAGARTPTTRFDLELHLAEAGEGLGATLVYRPELYDAETVERMAGHFTRLLESAVADPALPVSRLALLGPGERRRVLEEWNRTERPYPRGVGMNELFDAQVAARPDAPALVWEDVELSYRELDARANRLAHLLRGHGVGPEARVGVMLERGVELVVAILAVIKAGGAYVPLDPAYPAERLRLMLEDSGVRVLLTRSDLASPIGAAGLSVVQLDPAAGAPASLPAGPVRSGVDPENLAYIVYTSGSTGRPKGVMVAHRHVVQLVRETDYVRLAPGDRVAQASSASFDALTFEAWGALLNGATLVGIPRDVLLAPPAFRDTLREQRITTLYQTTALLNQLSREQPDVFAPLRQVLFGGQAADADGVRRLLAAGGPRRLLHMYGPTETTAWCSWEQVEAVPEDARTVPVGRATGNQRIYLLDAALEPVPIGVPGEAYVGGDGVVRGYLDRPALTAERFLPDPFGGEPGARMYRTGDRLRWTAAGRLEFVGRVDEQVKVRGFRIEPGEIEAVLCAHGKVGEARVVVREDEPGEQRLVAYVVGGAGADGGALREHLRRSLPEYMVPAAFVALDRIPLTPGGKLDVRALPAPEYAAGDRWVAPRTPTEEVLAGIWAALLGVERVGVHDGYFELGGHSLLATRVASRVREALGVELPLRALFEGPTVAELAERVDALRRAGEPASAPIPRADRTGPLPLSFPQERLWFLHGSQDTGAGFTIPVGVRIEGEGLDAGALERALSAVVERHEALRTVFPAAGGEARQRVLDPAPLALPYADLSGRPEGERDAGVARLALGLAEERYDLERGPLLRALLVRTGPAAHVLLLNLHHVVFDGWSVGVLVREVTACYRALRAGRAPSLPELPVQYADYAAWQRGWVGGEAAAEQLAYWRGRLAGLPALELAPGRPRAEGASYRGRALPLRLGAEQSERVRAAARERRCTPFMVLLAAFKVALAHHAGARDVVVGTDLAGRTRPELEALVGFFVNEVVLRTDLAGDPSLEEVLGRVRGTALDAFRNQDLPFALVVREVAGERGLGGTPLFQVMFGMDNTPAEAVEVDGLRMSPVDTSAGVSPWELSLYLRDTPAGIEGVFRFRVELFDAATVEDLRGDFLAALEALLRDPGIRLEALLGELSAGARARWQDRARAAEEASRARLKRVRRQGIAVEAEGRPRPEPAGTNHNG